MKTINIVNLLNNNNIFYDLDFPNFYNIINTANSLDNSNLKGDK